MEAGNKPMWIAVASSVHHRVERKEERLRAKRPGEGKCKGEEPTAVTLLVAI